MFVFSFVKRSWSVASLEITSVATPENTSPESPQPMGSINRTLNGMKNLFSFAKAGEPKQASGGSASSRLSSSSRSNISNSSAKSARNLASNFN